MVRLTRVTVCPRLRPVRGVPIELILLICGAVLAGEVLARPSPSSAAEAPPGSVRLRWLADLGAESLVASPRTASAGGRPLTVPVPGSAYVFGVASDGSLERRKRLAADPSAPYAVAVTDNSLALVGKEGSVQLWSLPPSGDLSLRWKRELGERATSVGMGSDDSVFVATWRNQLVALSATDGRSLWTADIGGRAEAPAVVDGNDVFLATKAKALVRIDAATGGVRWKVGLPGVALHPPVVLGGTARLVVCGTWDGQLLAYDALTGRLRWSVPLSAKLAGTPLAGPGLVAAVTADGAVHAYDPASGQARWTEPESSEGPATMVLSRSPGRGVAPNLLVISKRLVALDLASGTQLAEYPKGAVQDLRRRFADAMLEGVKTYSEGEKHALLEQAAFDLAGAPFGPARVVGPDLIFGTEEEWVYLFDASTLRPLARYHGGQPCSRPPLLAADRVLAVAGEEVLGLDSATGRTLWKRTLGAAATATSVGATVGIVAAGRAHALHPADGVLQWSVRGRFRSVAPPEPAAPGKPVTVPWLADDGEGNLRALWPSGRLGEPLPVAGELLAILPSWEGSWVVATREGKVFGIAWDEPSSGSGGPPTEGRLVKRWEQSFDERLAEVRLVERRLVVRAESGTLVGFDEARQEIWRLHLSGEERFEIAPRAASLLISSAAELRVHDWLSGEMRLQWKVESPAVGADVRGTSLLWLDRSGRAYRVDIPERRLLESADLGVPLAAATATPDGFLVTTAAGEVGLVEVGAGGQGAAANR